MRRQSPSAGLLAVLAVCAVVAHGQETAAEVADPGPVGLTFYGDEFAHTDKLPNWPVTDFTITMKIRATTGDLLSYGIGPDDSTFNGLHFAMRDVTRLQIWRGPNDVWDTETSMETDRTGAWHSLALTSKMRTGEMKLYKDGVMVADTIMSKGTPMQINGAFLIGQVPTCPLGCFEDYKGLKGTVADVTVWDRDLSLQQIDYLHHQRPAGDESNLVLNWPLADKDATRGIETTPTGATSDLILGGTKFYEENPFLGCYVEDSNHDLKSGPLQPGYTTSTCDNVCRSYDYFALSDGGICSCANQYGTTYTKSENNRQFQFTYSDVDESQCGAVCAGEEELWPKRYCGGTNRNAVYRTGVPGATTKSLEFDGSGVAFAEAGGDLPTGDMTVEFWLKLGAIRGFQEEVVVVAYRDASGSEPFVIRNPPALELTRNGDRLQTFASCGDARWQHVAVTWVQETGQTIVYKDGINVYPPTWTNPLDFDKLPTLDAAGSLPARPLRLFIGGQEDSSDRGRMVHSTGLIGFMSDFRIWDNVRTMAQIQQHKNNYFIGNFSVHGLILNWRMSDDAGSSVLGDALSSTNATIARPTWENVADAPPYPTLDDVGVIEKTQQMKTDLDELFDYVSRVLTPKIQPVAEDGKVIDTVPGLPWDLSGYGLSKDWYLVRRVGSNESRWHAATDQLAGNDMYGTFVDDTETDVTFSVPWSGVDFTEFLFAMGDMSSWLIASKDAVTAGYYDESSRRTFIASSLHTDGGQAGWIKREGTAEDPWIGLTDHAADVASGSLLYGEGSFDTAGYIEGLAAHKGANVFIRGAHINSTAQCDRKYRWKCKHFTLPADVLAASIAESSSGNTDDADAALASQQLLQTSVQTAKTLPPHVAKGGRGGRGLARHKWKKGGVVRTHGSAPVAQLRRELVKGAPQPLAR